MHYAYFEPVCCFLNISFPFVTNKSKSTCLILEFSSKISCSAHYNFSSLNLLVKSQKCRQNVFAYSDWLVKLVCSGYEFDILQKLNNVHYKDASLLQPDHSLIRAIVILFFVVIREIVDIFKRLFNYDCMCICRMTFHY